MPLKKTVIVFFIVGLIGCEKLDVPKGTPRCIKKEIKKQKDNGLGFVYSYQYKGETVYLFGNISNAIIGDCNSIKRDLYTEDCDLICSPTCTGSGDARCPDFWQEATGEKEIWANE